MKDSPRGIKYDEDLTLLIKEDSEEVIDEFSLDLIQWDNYNILEDIALQVECLSAWILDLDALNSTFDKLDLSNSLVLDALRKIHDKTNELLKKSHSNTYTFKSDISILTKTKWRKLIEKSNLVQIIDENWKIVAFKISWKEYKTFHYLLCVDENTIAVCISNFTKLFFIDKKNGSNIIWWIKKTDAINKDTCKYANNLLNKWYSWKLSYIWDKVYLLDKPDWTKEFFNEIWENITKKNY